MADPAAQGPDPDLALAEYVATTFYDDPLGFVLYAFPWGEGALSGETGPDEWQRQFLIELGEQVKANAFDGVNSVTPIRMARASGHGIGKSALVAWIILWIASTRVNSIGTVTANTATQLETKTWKELAKWTGLCITGHWFKLGASNLAHKQHPRTWRCDAVTCEERNSEAFAGQHEASSTSYYIFDEASAVPDIIHEVAQGGLTDGEPMIFLFGNPTRNSGKFREVFGRMRHRWNVAQIDSRDTKKANKTLIAEWAQDYGEDSDFFRVRVKGEFPRAGSTQFIPSDLVEMAYDAARDPHVTVMDPMVIGVDVARFGDDQSVICFRRGHDARSIPPLKFRGLDLMQLAARVAEAWERFKADAVFVDETGIGAGVVDRLRMLRIPVSGISFSAKADRAYPAGDGADRAGYANKRAEIWGMMREWLKYGSIPYDRELIDDLTAVEYGYVMREGKDVILLEKKENMKQRGLASPDCFVAGTLVSTPRGPVPIEALERGDEVLTPMGVARVTWRWVSRTEALTTAKFSNGAYLTGKGAHKVFTWQGACRLDALSLTIGIDTDGRWSRMLWRLASLSFMQAASFGFKQATDTFSPGSRLTRRGYFTAAYMRTITDLSRRIGMSTTLTATGATTTPATSPSCPGAIIPRSICETELLPTLKPTNKTLLWRETRQGLGMPQTRDWTGTAGTPKPHGQTEEGSTSRVRSADPTSPPPLPVAPAIVHQPAPSAFNSGPISRTIGRALGAAMSLLRIVTGRRLVVPVSVLTESAPPTLVYNLTLDRHNAYYANGVLVFNCADALALTFAYPVGASDHRAILSKKHSHHVTDYDPTAQMIGRR